MGVGLVVIPVMVVTLVIRLVVRRAVVLVVVHVVVVVLLIKLSTKVHECFSVPGEGPLLIKILLNRHLFGYGK